MSDEDRVCCRRAWRQRSGRNGARRIGVSQSGWFASGTRRRTTGTTNVVANPTLWFLQHYMWGLPVRAGPRSRPAHRVVTAATSPSNQAFADATVAELEREPGAAVFFHDYHLYLAPKLVRRPASLMR